MILEFKSLKKLNTVSYTLKALSAGFWAYFNATDFESGLLKVIHEGGDADTNACVAASILGAKMDIAPFLRNTSTVYLTEIH